MNHTIQLLPNVYLFQGVVGGRPLSLPLLVGSEKALLIDTGCHSDVERLILPGLGELGLAPSRLSLVVNTHCDVDHQGGNGALKRLAPQALLCCGDADRGQIESPATILEERYNAYAREDDRLALDASKRDWILHELGAPQPVDLTFRGGEAIRLAGNWSVEVLHLPGHSHGHLGILDRRHRALFGGDAIHGEVYLDLDGHPALCPTYLYVPEYLQTIGAIERLDLDLYSGCHWAVRYGEGIGRFCAESRLFVERAERLALEALAGAPGGKSLRDLCLELGPQLGRWPAPVHLDLRFALNGHLEDLAAQGRVRRVAARRPVRYELCR